MSANVLTELKVDFHGVDAQLRENLRLLQSAEQTERVRAAIAGVERAIAQVRDSCHPSMDIPLSLRD